MFAWLVQNTSVSRGFTLLLTLPESTFRFPLSSTELPSLLGLEHVLLLQPAAIFFTFYFLLFFILIYMSLGSASSYTAGNIYASGALKRVVRNGVIKKKIGKEESPARIYS